MDRNRPQLKNPGNRHPSSVTGLFNLESRVVMSTSWPHFRALLDVALRPLQVPLSGFHLTLTKSEWRRDSGDAYSNERMGGDRDLQVRSSPSLNAKFTFKSLGGEGVCAYSFSCRQRRGRHDTQYGEAECRHERRNSRPEGV